MPTGVFSFPGKALTISFASAVEQTIQPQSVEDCNRVERAAIANLGGCYGRTTDVDPCASARFKKRVNRLSWKTCVK